MWKRMCSHVMVFAQLRQVRVQLLDLLLMCLDAFALQAFVELHTWISAFHFPENPIRPGFFLNDHTRLRRVFSCRFSASVFPAVSSESLSCFCCCFVATSCPCAAVSRSEGGSSAGLVCLFSVGCAGVCSFFLFRFLSIPAFLAPLSLRAPPAVAYSSLPML